MKLHAFDAERAMAHSHDFPLGRLSRNLKTGGQRLSLYNQRMVASSVKRTRQLTKDGLPVMPDLRRFPMHQSFRSHDFSAERRGQKRKEAEERQRQSAARKPIESRIKRLEEKMAKLNAQKSAIDAQLADPASYGEARKETLKALILDQAYVARELTQLEAEWLEQQQKLEQATAQAKIAMTINPKITAEDNTYVRSLGVPEVRARIAMDLRRAGLK